MKKPLFYLFGLLICVSACKKEDFQITVPQAKPLEATNLLKAAGAGDSATVAQLLKEGVDVNVRGRNDSTALILAARGGHVKVVGMLLTSSEIDVNAQTSEGWTALMIAAQYSSADMVEALVHDPRMSINMRNPVGQTAFEIAQERGEVDVVAAFPTEAMPAEVSLLALYNAIRAKEADTVRALATSANINDKIAGDSTALMVAARYADAHVLGILLSVPGIDINAALLGSGNTALMIAVYHKNAVTFQKLIWDGDRRLRAGLHVRKCNKLGKTAYNIIYESYAGPYPLTHPMEIIIRTFILTSYHGYFTLPELASCGSLGPYGSIIAEDVAAVRSLVTSANINRKFSSYTPLMLAARHNSGTDVIDVLLSIPQIDVNIQSHADGIGWTALMLASTHNSAQMVEKLATDSRTEINMCDDLARTALTMAKARTDAAKDAVVSALERVGATDGNCTSSRIYDMIRRSNQVGLSFSLKAKHINTRIAGDSTVLMVVARYIRDDGDFISRFTLPRILALAGADFSATTAEGWTALMIATQHNTAEVVRQFAVASSSRINMCNTEGKTALKIAQERGEADVVAAFPAEASTRCGTSISLYNAIREADAATVRALATSANINDKIAGDSTALMVAARYADAHVVGVLLSVPGIDINAALLSSGDTALIIAVRHINAAAVRKLMWGRDVHLRPGLHVRKCNKLGKTAYNVFMESYAGPYPATHPMDIIVRTFVYTSRSGYFTLSEAASCGELGLYGSIMAEDAAAVRASVTSANVNLRFGRYTPLMLAVRNNIGTDVIDVLLSILQINVNEHTYGVTALMMAAKHKSAQMVQKLATDSRTDLNMCDDLARTALAMAKARTDAAKEAVVSALENAGATDGPCTYSRVYHAILSNNHYILLGFEANQINTRIAGDSTVLMVVARYIRDNNDIRRHALPHLLNLSGADFSATTAEGWTALMIAAKHNTAEVVRQFAVASSSRINMCNTEGKTALKIAQERGEADIVAAFPTEASTNCQTYSSP